MNTKNKQPGFYYIPYIGTPDNQMETKLKYAYPAVLPCTFAQIKDKTALNSPK